MIGKPVSVQNSWLKSLRNLNVKYHSGWTLNLILLINRIIYGWMALRMSECVFMHSLNLYSPCFPVFQWKIPLKVSESSLVCYCCDGMTRSTNKLFSRSHPLISLYAFDWHHQACVPHPFHLLYGGGISFSFIRVTVHLRLAIEHSFLISNILQAGSSSGGSSSLGLCQVGFYSVVIGSCNAEVLDITPGRVWGLQCLSAWSQLSARNESQSSKSAALDVKLITVNGFCVRPRWNPPVTH